MANPVKNIVIENKLQKLYGNESEYDINKNARVLSIKVKHKVMKLTFTSIIVICLFLFSISLISFVNDKLSTISPNSEEYQFYINQCDYFDSDISFYTEVKDQEYFIIYKGVNVVDRFNNHTDIYFYSLSEISSENIEMYINNKKYNLDTRYGVINVSTDIVNIKLIIDGKEYFYKINL